MVPLLDGLTMFSSKLILRARHKFDQSSNTFISLYTRATLNEEPCGKETNSFPNSLGKLQKNSFTNGHRNFFVVFKKRYFFLNGQAFPKIYGHFFKVSINTYIFIIFSPTFVRIIFLVSARIYILWKTWSSHGFCPHSWISYLDLRGKDDCRRVLGERSAILWFVY